MSLVGLVSDTHDHLARCRDAAALFDRLGVAAVIHCGDIVSQFALAEFGRLRCPLVGVFGNNDGDRPALEERAREFGFEFFPGPHRFELTGRVFSVSHEPPTARPDCDYIVHGHTHRPAHVPGVPPVINPGEACGWLTGLATVATVDTETGVVEFHELG
ncbi:metallophosphoesterase [candidate division WOR-3 bacterium]|nr:metallophosphoesterase [candidate division WOR-3 bacterium]